MVYLVTPAVMSVLAVWAAWRLVPSWSVVRAFVAFVVAMAYLVWGVPSGYGLGAFFIGRIWQGRSSSSASPCPWCTALTRWAQRGRPYDARMLLAVGAVAIGLTSTATLVVPPIAIGVAVTLLVCRRKRWAVPLLAAAYPVASGVVVAVVASGGGEFGAVAFSSFEAFHAVVGDQLWGVVGVAALLLAPWAVRPVARGWWLRRARRWRSRPWLGRPAAGEQRHGSRPDPLPAHVDRCPPGARRRARYRARAARLASPVVRRVGAVAVPVLLVGLIVAGGQLIWSRSTTLEDGPRWKYWHAQLERARWLAGTYDGEGPVLGPDLCAPSPCPRRASTPSTRGSSTSTASTISRCPRGACAPQRVREERQHPATADARRGPLAALGSSSCVPRRPAVRYRDAVADLGWDGWRAGRA